MNTYQTKFEGLIGKLQTERDVAINQLSVLQRQYTELIGKEDPSIQERIAALEKHYENRITRLNNMHLKFSDNRVMSDDHVRIMNANERGAYSQDTFYQAADESIQKKIQQRALNETDYWMLVFPEGAESKEKVKGKNAFAEVVDPVRSAIEEIFREAQGLAIPTSKLPNLDQYDRTYIG